MVSVRANLQCYKRPKRLKSNEQAQTEGRRAELTQPACHCDPCEYRIECRWLPLSERRWLLLDASDLSGRLLLLTGRDAGAWTPALAAAAAVRAAEADEAVSPSSSQMKPSALVPDEGVRPCGSAPLPLQPACCWAAVSSAISDPPTSELHADDTALAVFDSADQSLPGSRASVGEAAAASKPSMQLVLPTLSGRCRPDTGFDGGTAAAFAGRALEARPFCRILPLAG